MTVQSPPSVIAECPAISKPSAKYDSTNVKSSVPGDQNSIRLVSPTMPTPHALPFQQHKARVTLQHEELCSPEDLNNKHAESLSKCHQ